MPLLYRRILSGATFSATDTTDLTQAIDLGNYQEVHFVLTVTQAGDGDAPQLVVKHAPVNEQDAYLDFETAIAISLAATGTLWFHAESFTRWVYWFVSGTLSSDAIVTLDIIGK